MFVNTNVLFASNKCMFIAISEGRREMHGEKKKEKKTF